LNRSIWNFAFVFGLVFTLIGIFMLIHPVFLRTRCTEKTNGMIVSGNLWNRENKLMLTFTVNGEDYRLPFSYSEKMSAGMAVTVAYNPHKIQTYLNSFYVLEDVNHSRTMGIICIIAGFIAMLIGYGVSIGLFVEVWYF
jgi:hypothetical protein